IGGPGDPGCVNQALRPGETTYSLGAERLAAMVLWRLTARAPQGGPLSTGNSSRDADAVSLWDEPYGPAHLKDEQTLWGDPPVPYAVRAAELFKGNSSRVVI